MPGVNLAGTKPYHLPAKKALHNTHAHAQTYQPASAAALMVEGDHDSQHLCRSETLLASLVYDRCHQGPVLPWTSHPRFFFFYLLQTTRGSPRICAFLCKARSPKRTQRLLSSAGSAKLPAGTGSPSVWGMCVRRTPTHRQEHWHAPPNGPGQHTQVSISMQVPVKGSFILFLHPSCRSAKLRCTKTSEKSTKPKKKGCFCTSLF